MGSWEEYIRWYLRNGLYLFKIVPFGKRPVAGSEWANTSEHKAQPSMSFHDAIDWINQSGNIAIRLDHHVAFDIDAMPFKITGHQDYYRKFDTIVNFGSRGFHVLFDRSNIRDNKDLQPTFESKYNLKLDHANGDVVHTGNAYIIVPPSRVKKDDGSIKSYFFLDDRRVMHDELKIGVL